jgi:hypothetical protein
MLCDEALPRHGNTRAPALPPKYFEFRKYDCSMGWPV